MSLQYPIKERTPEVRIMATVRHVENNESFYVTRFRMVDGRMNETWIGRDAFRNPSHAASMLLKHHAALPDDPKAQERLVSDALRNKRGRAYDITSRCGWRGASFVYPTGTYGSERRQVRFAAPCEVDPALGLRRGKLADFKAAMKGPCRVSDYLVFALSVPAAGPLLNLIDKEEGALFHFHGTGSDGRSHEKTKSSSGKTLITRAAASVLGRARTNDLVTFESTERSLEDLCFAHNDMAVFLDEEGRASGSGAGRVKPAKIAYQLPSGRGAVRSNRAARDKDLANLTWRVMGISNGENPLDGRHGDQLRPEGAQVRQIPIPVPPGSTGGVFNRVKGEQSEMLAECRTLAMQVEASISETYGVVMPAYLKRLVKERDRSSQRTKRWINEFVEEVASTADPWERRFAEKFAIVLSASLLLVEFKIGPWTRKRAWKAVKALYRKSRSASISTDQATASLLQALQRAADHDGRFPAVEKGQSLSKADAKLAWGVVRKIDGHGRVLMCPYKRLRSLIIPAAVTRAVMKELAARGALVSASNGGLTRQTMIKELAGTKRRRYVCIKKKAINLA